MARRLAILAVVLVACDRAGPAPEVARVPGEPDVPVPGDFGLIALESRDAIENAVARCRAGTADAAAFAALGRLYHANQLSALALSAYDRAVALGDASAKTQYFRGLILEERGDARDALAAFEASRAAAPAYGMIPYHIGVVRLESGDPAGAIDAFRDAIRIDAKNVAAHIALARALRQSGGPALPAIEGALALDPDNPAAHQVAALIHREAGRADLAALHTSKSRAHRADVVKDEWFKEVQKLASGVAQGIARAEFMMESGRPDAAAAALQDLFSANPGRADVAKLLGRALALSGRLVPARGAYGAAARLDPRDASVRATLASLALDLGELESAIESARGAIALDATQWDARVVLAAALLRRGDTVAALDEVDAVLRARPDLKLAHVVRGDALLALRRPGDAVLAFDAALALDPGFAYARARRDEAARAPESR